MLSQSSERKYENYESVAIFDLTQKVNGIATGNFIAWKTSLAVDVEEKASQPVSPSVTYTVSTVAGELLKYAKVTVNNATSYALIDAGAAVTVVSESFFKFCAHSKFMKRPMNVRFVGAGAEPLSITGMARINIAIGSIQTQMIVYVCKNLNEYCI